MLASAVPVMLWIFAWLARMVITPSHLTPLLYPLPWMLKPSRVTYSRSTLIRPSRVNFRYVSDSPSPLRVEPALGAMIPAQLYVPLVRRTTPPDDGRAFSAA